MSSLSSDSEAWSDDFALLVILIAKALFLSPDTYFPVFVSVCLSVCACALFVCPGVGSWQVCFGSRTNGTKLCTHAQSVAVQGVRGLRVTQQTLICYSGSAVNLDLTAHPHRGETHTHRQTHTPCYLWGPVASDEFRLLDIKLLRLVCPKNQFIDSTSVKNDSFCFMIKLFFSQWCIFTLKLYIRIIFSGYTDCLCVSAPVCPFAKDCVAWFSVYLCSVFRPG